jgi:hypothetical protein
MDVSTNHHTFTFWILSSSSTTLFDGVGTPTTTPILEEAIDASSGAHFVSLLDLLVAMISVWLSGEDCLVDIVC